MSVLSGHTGVGKITIYRIYASKYPQYITCYRTVIPILAVTIPSPGTVKAIFPNSCGSLEILPMKKVRLANKLSA